MCHRNTLSNTSHSVLANNDANIYHTIIILNEVLRLYTYILFRLNTTLTRFDIPLPNTNFGGATTGAVLLVDTV